MDKTGQMTMFIRVSPFKSMVKHISEINKPKKSKESNLSFKFFQYKIANGSANPMYATLDKMMSNGRLDKRKMRYFKKRLALLGLPSDGLENMLLVNLSIIKTTKTKMKETICLVLI